MRRHDPAQPYKLLEPRLEEMERRLIRWILGASILVTAVITVAIAARLSFLPPVAIGIVGLSATTVVVLALIPRMFSRVFAEHRRRRSRRQFGIEPPEWRLEDMERRLVGCILGASAVVTTVVMLTVGPLLP